MNKSPADVKAEWERQIGAAMRKTVQEHDPELYEDLAKSHPLLYGPDSLARIQAEYPSLFSKPKG